jgi:GTPase SAR1 family protein
MKIGLCGTMSVGKTTLVNALKELPEFKDYTFRTERSKYLMEQGIPLNTDSTLKGQTVFLAERAMELIQENIITDRTVIDVMAFAIASKTINILIKRHLLTLLVILFQNMIISFMYLLRV